MYLARMHIDRIEDTMCVSVSTCSTYFFEIQKTLAHFTHRETLNCGFLGTINTYSRLQSYTTTFAMWSDNSFVLNFLKFLKTLAHSIGRDLSFPGVLLATATV